MHPSHAHSVTSAAPDLGMALLLGLWLLVPGLYLLALRRAARRGRPWSHWRTASFMAGAVLVLIGLLPVLVELAHRDLRAHMLQHLLLGMVGPVGLVLGAPVTLALRALPVPAARRLMAVLRTPAIHVLCHPVTALVLNVGGMAALYLTPLYAALATRPWLHVLVHVHFLAAGCLFSWAIAGADPGPARPSHARRLAVLFVAMATHATLAKVMYAQGLPRGTRHSLEEVEAAARLMFYGGDLSELLLAVALFATWPWASRAERRPRGRAALASEGSGLRA